MIWAGAVMVWAGAVMIWAGAVMIWAGACSNTNFSTLKRPKNAKKAKCDGPTDGRTDRPTADTVTYRSRARDKKGERLWLGMERKESCYARDVACLMKICERLKKTQAAAPAEAGYRLK